MTTVVKFKYKDHEPVLDVQWGKGEGWWEGCTFIALTIVAVAKKLIESGNGCPQPYYEGAILALGGTLDMQWDYWRYQEFLDKAQVRAIQDWQNALTTIVDGLNIMVTEEHHYDSAKKSKVDEAMLLLACNLDYFWD